MSSQTGKGFLQQRLHPLSIFILLLLLIAFNAVAMDVLVSEYKIVLICLGFLAKGFLVIDYLMGLQGSPRWVRWPMLAYFVFFCLLFSACFVLMSGPSG